MNYVFGPKENCCCTLERGDDIHISSCLSLVDDETGEISYPTNVPELGHKYTCKKMWHIMRGYVTIGCYESEDEAKYAIRKLVESLRDDNVVYVLE